MNSPFEKLIQTAIAEAKLGNRKKARTMLGDLVRQEPGNARVWYLLSQVVEKSEQSILCLERVLELQPDNVQAKEKLDSIRIGQNIASGSTAKSPFYTKPKKKASPWLWVVGGSGCLLTILCLCILAFSFFGVTTIPTQIAAILPITQAPIKLPVIILPPTWTPTFTPEPSATSAPTASPTLIPPTESSANAPTTPLAPVTASAFAPSPPASGNSLRVYFFDVGQGDATLIQTFDGKNVLVDGGEPNTGIVDYLQGLNVQRIDIMFATHPDSDHIGGLVQVLQVIPVAKVVTNGQTHTTPVYESFLEAIDSARTEYVEVKRGDSIQAGSLNIQVLSPIDITRTDINENSLVLQFGYGNTTFLMMGDAGKSTETSLMASGLLLKADILKVGHHGSDSGSSPAFLNVVGPKVAIYFAGVNNQFNLPDPQTITALEAVGAQIYGTDKDGTIVVTVDSSGYTIHAGKNGTRLEPIVSVTSPISPGAMATLLAKTVPGARCTIEVITKSGPSEAQGLEPKTADSNGNVSWTWEVGTRTTAGDWQIIVTANVNGQNYIKETIFTVR
jgi:competence protein ComEC